MFQRTVYSGVIGLSGLVGIVGALRPWVQGQFTMVGADDVGPVRQVRSGIEPFTLVLSYAGSIRVEAMAAGELT